MILLIEDRVVIRDTYRGPPSARVKRDLMLPARRNRDWLQIAFWGERRNGSSQVASRWMGHYAQRPTVSTANWHSDLRPRGRAPHDFRGIRR
jgi:alkyl sulfatase BDS1-like metallo-beta-lactamase superfamily hydrolase